MTKQMGRDAIERALFTPRREGCGGPLVCPDDHELSYLPPKRVVSSSCERGGDTRLEVSGVTSATGKETRRLAAGVSLTSVTTSSPSTKS